MISSRNELYLPYEAKTSVDGTMDSHRHTSGVVAVEGRSSFILKLPKDRSRVLRRVWSLAENKAPRDLDESVE